jgi:hypothetical protein
MEREYAMKKAEAVMPTLADSDVQEAEEFSTPERLNIRLSPEIRKALDWIAANLGVSAVEAVRRAIGTQKFFLDLTNQKAKIFVQLPGEKNLKEVVFANVYASSA